MPCQLFLGNVFTQKLNKLLSEQKNARQDFRSKKKGFMNIRSDMVFDQHAGHEKRSCTCDGHGFKERVPLTARNSVKNDLIFCGGVQASDSRTRGVSAEVDLLDLI